MNMHRTTVLLDPALLEETVRLTGARSQTEAIRIALAAYVRQRKKDQLLALQGNLDVADDWQALRELEYGEPIASLSEVAEPAGPDVR